MSRLTFAVAGHVDHGKTALVQALTGVDTDRLAEEKRRGLTIEPGFAPLDLPGGVRVSLVDMPGHEKFIGNLLSSAAGLDGVLLTVAADEGFMPQTWEHLTLLSLLGVRRGVAVLTKADRVDAGALAEAVEQTVLALAGTPLAGAPVVVVSPRTGQGLDGLRAALSALAEDCPPHTGEGPFRLPVDRAFSAPGLGSVVTGTVWAGQVRAGDPVRLYPSDALGRVRSVQIHGEDVPVAQAGTRAALCLAGTPLEALGRGVTAAAPGSLTVVRRFDADLTLLEEVRPGQRLRLYLGSAHAFCRISPADGARPGRVRLEEPAALRPGDRFVLRSLSPAHTVGGGTVLAPSERGGRSDPAQLVQTALAAWHGSHPLSPGMNREQLKALLPDGTDLEALRDAGALTLSGPTAALPGFVPAWPEDLLPLREALLRFYDDHGLDPPENQAVERRFGGAPVREAARRLEEEGALLSIAPRRRMGRGPYERARAVLTDLLRGGGSVTLAQFRDAAGTTREPALRLLEHWDGLGLTRRVGDRRFPGRKFQ